jgi:hypothetical protein
VTCGQKWLARLTAFFAAGEREQAGCQHRLFFSRIEFCENLIFHRRDATADFPITRTNCATISARATWANQVSGGGQSSFRTYLVGPAVVMVAEFGILGCEAQRSASPATKSE